MCICLLGFNFIHNLLQPEGNSDVLLGVIVWHFVTSQKDVTVMLLGVLTFQINALHDCDATLMLYSIETVT